MRRGAQRWAVAGTMLAALARALAALDFTALRAGGTFGAAAVLLWLLLWGASIAPLPILG